MHTHICVYTIPVYSKGKISMDNFNDHRVPQASILIRSGRENLWVFGNLEQFRITRLEM